MADKYNPFRPDKICPPGMFAGRIDELRAIDRCLIQTKNGNPQHFLISGERGIGKSSILLCETFVARGLLETNYNKRRLNFIILELSLSERDDYYNVLKKIATELKRRIDGESKLRALTMTALDYLSRIEAGGVRFNRNPGSAEPEDIFNHLQDDLVRILTSLDDRDGVLLLIDEADKAPAESSLGAICKLLTEELTRRGCDRLCIGLAGLPSLLDSLKASHESSVRLFQTMNLKPLDDGECEQVIDAGLKEAIEKNGFNITITPDAKGALCKLSEGYPHFLQEFAFSAFEEDSDNVIDGKDVSESLFKENGAFDQLGRKYFDQYYAAPNSDDYRKMLDAMAEHSDEWISRAAIIAESGVKGSTVDNGLRALRTKTLIIQDEMRMGFYKLPTKSFAVWIKAKKLRQRAALDGQAPMLFERDAEA